MTKLTDAQRMARMTDDELIKLANTLRGEINKRRRKLAKVMAGPLALCEAVGVDAVTMDALYANRDPKAARRTAEVVALKRRVG